MLHLPTIAEMNPWWEVPTARCATAFPARRDFQRRLVDFAREEGRRAFVVLGPRQVGKSVALHQVADDLLDESWPPGNLTHFDFSDDRIVEAISPREIASIEPPGMVPGRPRLLLLDEITRAPRWQEWLKQAVDLAESIRIIATGSVASALREGSRESGQGRWDEFRVGGLTFDEHLRFHSAPLRISSHEVLRRNPNEVERYLQLGGFPEHVLETEYGRSRARIRADIADRAIARDLANTGIDVEGVRRLFVYLAAESGAIFSARERARDLDVDERSIKSWIDRLLDAQLIARLDQHSKGSKRLRTKPKIYAEDHGLVSAFAASPVARDDAAAYGRIVETAVYRHLRHAYDDPRAELRYFRGDGDFEGDFVVGVGGDPIVVEVTSSRIVKPSKIARLRRVGAVIGTKRLTIIHLGFTDHESDGVRLLPLERFLIDPRILENVDV